MALLVEPNPPDPSVHILLPPLKALKSLVERLKKLDEVAHCFGWFVCSFDAKDSLGGMQHGRSSSSGCSNGFCSCHNNHFWIGASQGVSCCCFRPNFLFVDQVDGAESAPPRDPELWGQARVDMKKFSKFLV
jgi:hypothetical protein